MTLPVTASMLTALSVVDVDSAIGATLSSETVCANTFPGEASSANHAIAANAHWRSRIPDLVFNNINSTPKHGSGGCGSLPPINGNCNLLASRLSAFTESGQPGLTCMIGLR